MITIKTFIFNSFQVNTFILHDETGNAIIIDPACSNANEIELLKQYIATNSLIPKCIANTHGHIDHILGVNQIMNFYKIPFKVHYDDLFLLQTAKEAGTFFGFTIDSIPIPTDFIKEGDKIEFGNSSLDLLHIPGHSPGSIVFYSPSDNFLIAGDVLFRGSIGRTDLPGGNYESLIDGIKSKLLTLPKETVVYSGHGPSTTIQYEHDTNPFLI